MAKGKWALGALIGAAAGFVADFGDAAIERGGARTHRENLIWFFGQDHAVGRRVLFT